MREKLRQIVGDDVSWIRPPVADVPAGLRPGDEVVEAELEIGSDRLGLVVGSRFAGALEIERETGAVLAKLDDRARNGLVLRGTREQVAAARRAVEAKLARGGGRPPPRDRDRPL